MPDSTPDKPAAAPLLNEELSATLQAAKPLAPRPRPAFTRRAGAAAAAPAKTTSIDLSDIPEAVPLEDIPEGISLSDAPTSQRTLQSTTSRPAVRALGNRKIQPKAAPRNRVSEISEPEPPAPKPVIDKSKFASFDKYEKGDIAVKPLEKAPGVESRQVQRIEVPKFLDGELPRSVERGVQYPLPGRVIFTSITLLLFKLTLFLTVIGLTACALFASESMQYALILPAALIIFGIFFLSSASRTRCRICSCHMFYNRRCFKHAKAHRIFGLGYGGSAALHAILFKWLRCMYCGTAVRLRAPKESAAEAETNRPIESQQANYDKSLIKPRAPR